MWGIPKLHSDSRSISISQIKLLAIFKYSFGVKRLFQLFLDFLIIKNLCTTTDRGELVSAFNNFFLTEWIGLLLIEVDLIRYKHERRVYISCGIIIFRRFFSFSRFHRINVLTILFTLSIWMRPTMHSLSFKK